jgi:hypothetical protein
MRNLSKAIMSKVSLRRLLSKLTALALSTSTVGPAAADAMREAPGLDTADANDGPGALDADDADLDASLPIDREHFEAHDAASTLGRSLALALGEMRPLSATFLATTWSLSDDGLRRLAIAHALEWVFPLVGDALVIDHLSYDDDPAIRAAAARAAWARRQAGGDLGVLARLSHDPDPQVRSVAGSARSS